MWNERWLLTSLAALRLKGLIFFSELVGKDKEKGQENCPLVFSFLFCCGPLGQTAYLLFREFWCRDWSLCLFCLIMMVHWHSLSSVDWDPTPHPLFALNSNDLISGILHVWITAETMGTLVAKWLITASFLIDCFSLIFFAPKSNPSHNSSLFFDFLATCIRFRLQNGRKRTRYV